MESFKKGVDYIGVGVVFACHDGKGKFLFAKRGKGARDGHGLWELPAGGLDYGETVEEGMLRELKEELGVEPITVEYMGYRDLIAREEDRVVKHWIAFDFLVEVDPAKIQIMEPESCETVEWRTLDDIPGELHHGVDGTIANIQKYLESQ
jgi:ADP-ribose pyrophosphatase YjhB (NUDIX family)